MGGALFDGTSKGAHGHLVCHCLLVESDSGLILVDTGYGQRDVADPGRRLPAALVSLTRPRLRMEETAAAQVRRLGFRVEDVRHIIVTHLDFDHAGGIEDFPNAAVHVTAREKEVANAAGGKAFVNAARYQPQQWDEAHDWRLYVAGEGESWFGFDAVRDLDGLPPELLLVPLAGHTWGHAGVAVREDDGRWLFAAGDAYFFRGEVGAAARTCPPGLRAYQRLMEVDAEARMRNQSRLRELSMAHSDEVRMFCGHDAVEFAILSGETAEPAH